MVKAAERNRIKVADYISRQIDLSGKKQNEIAREVGYDKPNVITMIKQGLTKLPLNKVGLFAKALNVDPVHLLKITMNEYMPETWEVIDELVGKSLVTDNEARLIRLIRDATGNVDFDPDNMEKSDLHAIFSAAKRAASAETKKADKVVKVK